MIRIEWIGIGIFLMAGCKHAEPSATKYRKSLEAGPASTGGGGVIDPNADVIIYQPEPGEGSNSGSLVAQGEAIFTERCSSCHKTIDTTDLRSSSAAKITAAASRSEHKAVNPFPNADEAKALEAALK